MLHYFVNAETGLGSEVKCWFLMGFLTGKLSPVIFPLSITSSLSHTITQMKQSIIRRNFTEQIMLESSVG